VDFIWTNINRVRLDAGNEWDEMDSWLNFYREMGY